MKYILFTPLSVVGFISMYVYGGAIVTFIKTMDHLMSHEFVEAFVDYYITSALPPTSVEHVLLMVFVGTFTAGVKWFIAMAAL